MKMMIMRSQKPLTLSAAGMGVMTLPTFLRVTVTINIDNLYGRQEFSK